MYIGVPLLLAHQGRHRRCIIKGLAVQNNTGPVVLGVVDLHQGRGGGHDDGGGNAGGLSRIGHALGVVARRSGNQPPLLLLLGEGGALKVSAPDFVGPGHLHVLRLDVDMVAGGLGEERAVNQVRGVEHTFQNLSGLFEIF